jgi:hypothetical protein
MLTYSVYLFVAAFIYNHNLLKWEKTAPAKLASPANTALATVPPSESSSVKSKFPNTAVTAAPSAARTLSRDRALVFGIAKVVRRLLLVALTV